jgi:hypothetical protein
MGGPERSETPHHLTVAERLAFDGCKTVHRSLACAISCYKLLSFMRHDLSSHCILPRNASRRIRLRVVSSWLFALSTFGAIGEFCAAFSRDRTQRHHRMEKPAYVLRGSFAQNALPSIRPWTKVGPMKTYVCVSGPDLRMCGTKAPKNT